MKRILTLIILTFALGSCWYPPFEENVSLAVEASGKLNLDYTILAKRWPDGSVFCPVPLTSPGGFILTGTSEEALLTYAERSYLTPDPVASGTPLPILEGFNPFESSVFGVYATSPQLVTVFPGAEQGGAWNSDVALFSYDTGLKALDPAPDYFSFVSDIAFPLYFSVSEPGIAVGDLELAGLAITPSSDATKTNLHSLIRKISDGSFYELSFSLAEDGTTAYLANIVSDRSDGLLTVLPAEGVSALPSDKVRYFMSAVSGRGYANYLNGSSYKTLSWGADGLASEVGIKEKICAVLSTGDVLTEKDGYGKVYGPTGSLRFKFALGDLHFIYEVYKNDELTLIFSTYAEGKYLDPQYTVYSLPTADLDTLH